MGGNEEWNKEGNRNLNGNGTWKWREGGLIERDGGIRVKPEGAAEEHKAREVSHNRLRLNMEVAEHFIRVPATDEADVVSVDIGAQ